MKIQAKILADSINGYDCRLTSFQLTYPRCIHSEIMTHRVFSRNAASSRAIPVKKMLEIIKNDPFVPLRWGKNQKGMQAFEELDAHARHKARGMWMRARNLAVACTQRLAAMDLHKQLANRISEPFYPITIILSGTEFHNFFSLRAHGDAEDHFQVLAYTMLREYLASKPKKLGWFQWHLPYSEKVEGLDEETKLKVITARCARLSYLTHDGAFSVEKDIELHDSLLANGHMSPFEHCAQAYPEGQRSNFGIGWQQYRKTLPNENRENLDLQAIYSKRPDWVKALMDAENNPGDLQV